jgi:uncharacterized membrane protein YfcA
MSPLLWVVVGVVVGTYGTLIGAGGGFVLVPVLLFVYPHVSASRLTAVSLAAVFANAASGSVGYQRMGLADYRSGIVLAVATIPGAVAGALVVNAIPIRLFDLIMGASLVVVSLYLLFRPGGSLSLLAGAPWTVSRHLVDAQGVSHDYRFNLGLAAAFSTVIGFLSSLLGIGGGIIHVPMLTTLFSFPAHVATATSQFVLMITALTGSLTHIVHGDYNGFVTITVALAIGVVIGGQAGSALSRRVSARAIIRLLAVALLVVGVRLTLLAGG